MLSLHPKPRAEHITNPQDDTREDWATCPCGNRPDLHGYVPCDDEGNEVEPVPGGLWTDLWVCRSCGRIWHEESGLVLGRAQAGYRSLA